MKQILIMRHAKSDWNNSAQSDFERPLNERGRKVAPLMGNLLKKKKLIPELILSSTAERASETTHAIARECELSGDEIVFIGDFYNGYITEVTDKIKKVDDKISRVMVVGHNPTWTNLVTHLSGEFSEMKTAEICVLEFDGNWSMIGKGTARFLKKLSIRNAE